MRYITALLFFFITISANFKLIAQEQEQLNLPGDNLNLYAVLKLFQESQTLESFEKSLNDEKNKINNLDLNGDGKIDYIFVDDSVVNNVHNILLRIAVNASETQNVAVIAVEKDNNGQVNMQLIGDEDLYGKDYIVEPGSEGRAETPNPGYMGNASQAPIAQENVSNAYYPVNTWPVIQYIYVPTYNPWRSPWYWDNYPSYWNPWQPFYWHTYYAYQYHWNYYYTAHYRQVNVYRIPGWRQQYYSAPGFRSRSVVVQTRYQQGNYRQTYSRPQSANRGSEMFRRDHPNAPSVNAKLPPFDNNGRPIVSRPISRPGDNNGSRPGTRPSITNPVTRPVTNPSTRPITNPGTRPITKPVTPPAVTNPSTRPVINQPTRPINNPSTRPATNPGARPMNRPSVNNPGNRPITNPTNRPTNNPPTRPIYNPSARPATRPMTQPAQRPISNEGARPAARPQISQPSQRAVAPAARPRDDH